MATTDQLTDDVRPYARPRPARMRDLRSLTGELVHAPITSDSGGRPFTPTMFTAHWERTGGPDQPWTTRVHIQGPAVLKDGSVSPHHSRSLVYDAQRPMPPYLSAITDYTPQETHHG